MEATRITIDRAMIVYLPTLPSAKTRRESGFAVRRFLRRTRLTYFEDIRAVHYDAFLEGSKPRYRECLICYMRGFVRWATKTYNLLAYPPSTALCAQARRLPTQPPSGPRGMEAVLYCAAKLQLPHQRLILLCGFLWGWSLLRIQRATLGDLLSQPRRADLDRLIAECGRGTEPYKPLLWVWLRGQRSAYNRWRQWIGGGVSFKEITLAGDVARRQLGVRTVVLNRQATLNRAMPPLDEASIGRMPILWEDL